MFVRKIFGNFTKPFHTLNGVGRMRFLLVCLQSRCTLETVLLFLFPRLHGVIPPLYGQSYNTWKSSTRSNNHNGWPSGFPVAAARIVGRLRNISGDIEENPLSPYTMAVFITCLIPHVCGLTIMGGLSNMPRAVSVGPWCPFWKLSPVRLSSLPFNHDACKSFLVANL